MQFKMSFIWHHQVKKNIQMFFHYGNKLLTKHYSWSKIMVCKYLKNLYFVGVVMLVRMQYPLKWCACYVEGNRMSVCWLFGLRLIAAYTLSQLSGVRTVLTPPPGFLFVAEAVVWNISTQFLKVLWSGTFPCLPALQCHLNIHCTAIVKSLFFKTVSVANAWCTADHWTVFTKWHP